MVQLNSTFDTDGPPFSSWRNGYGFGKVCRSYINDPSIIVSGRATASGPNYYRENRFWKGKWEMGQVNSLGIGERPDYGKQGGSAQKPSPGEYGDVSKKLNTIKKNVV